MPGLRNSETTTAEPKPRRPMLHAWHDERGAQWRTIEGHSVVAHYGSAGEERAQARGGTVLVDVSDRARLELVGEDRVRFLGGLVTCDVSALAAGEGCYGYFTSPKGRVLADVVVLALEDRLWLELPRGASQEIREHLQKYIVADRVDVRSLDDVLLFRVVGAVEAWLTERGVDPLSAPFGHRAAELEGTDMHIAASPLEGMPAVSLWISSGIAGPVVEDLLATGLRLAGQDCLEMLRVPIGVPRFGADFDDSNLPQEIRVDAAVSYEKGCYLGQEIVARLHYRGQPARELRRVRGEGPAPEVASPLLADGSEVGRLTSVSAVEPSAPTWSALAMIERRALDQESLQAPEGATVTILGPPAVEL